MGKCNLKYKFVSYLISVVKAVVHKSSNKRCFPNWNKKLIIIYYVVDANIVNKYTNVENIYETILYISHNQGKNISYSGTIFFMVNYFSVFFFLKYLSS